MPNERRPLGTPLDHDARELHRALTELVRVYQFRDRKRICCRDISVTQWYALDALSDQCGQTLTSLSETLYIDDSTASRVVDSLEKKGLTERVRDDADGRRVRIHLTAAGRELHATVEQDLLKEHERLLADIEPEIRRATARLIGRLARHAADRVSRTDGRCCR